MFTGNYYQSEILRLRAAGGVPLRMTKLDEKPSNCFAQNDNFVKKSAG